MQTGLPGVLFVLPDSYVDAENKDYGGNCFVNIIVDQNSNTTVTGPSAGCFINWNMGDFVLSFIVNYTYLVNNKQ
jgi:hypothetical protein